MIFGYFWVFLGIFGYFWVLLGIFGYFWVLYCIDIVPILISYRYCIDILTYRTALEEEIFCLSYPDARDCCPLGLVLQNKQWGKRKKFHFQQKNSGMSLYNEATLNGKTLILDFISTDKHDCKRVSKIMRSYI